MSAPIVERLRATERRYSSLTGEHTHDVYCNRDGMEAADTIEALLRALEPFADAITVGSERMASVNSGDLDLWTSFEAGRDVRIKLSHLKAAAAAISKAREIVAKAEGTGA